MATLLGLVAVVAIAAYIRLAPSDLARWHVLALANDPWGPWGEVVAGQVSATLRLLLDGDDASAMLARLDAIALATPRTRRLAGGVAEGRITWVTRSALWGFPDYTTAEAQADGITIFARLRFGGGDSGVNAARLRDWLSQL